MKKVAMFTLVMGIFAGSVMANSYKVNSSQSQLQWVGEKVTGKHNGVVQLQGGELSRTDNAITGTFNIDMTTIVNHDIESAEYNAKLVNHLKSDDFFSVEKHPVSTFSISKVAPYSAKEGESATHIVTGDLTIKGITNEITFPAEIAFSEEGMTANAAFTIDRAKWNVRYGSGSFFDNLGDKMIYDDIKFDLTLVAEKVTESMSVNK